MRICAFGDLLLDVVVRPDGPIRPDTDTYGQTSLVLGGQTANVAAWTVALGGAGRLLAARADDLAGRPIAGELQRVGVELVGPLLAGRTGSVVSISTPDGGRTMLIDRGVAAALAPATLEACWVAGCDWLYAFGYALAAEPCRRAALSAAALARDSGARVALDIASVGALAAAGRAMPEACAALSADVVLATEAERAALPGLTAPTAVVKRAAAGVVVEMQGTIRTLPALPATLVDATGAGDAFAAGPPARRRRARNPRRACARPVPCPRPWESSTGRSASGWSGRRSSVSRAQGRRARPGRLRTAPRARRDDGRRLDRLHATSGGRTLAVNRALIVDNAALAGEIAARLAV